MYNWLFLYNTISTVNLNLQKYKTFRNQYPTFCYESFSYNYVAEGLQLKFLFTIDETIRFEPTAIIPYRTFYRFDTLTKEQYDLLVFHIGMIELISYWKATCSPEVVIKPYVLSEAQISFWKKLYFNGLGEFFYVNGIEVLQEDFMKIRCASEAPVHKTTFDTSDRFIVPIGGGKDSVVTLELLRKAGKDFCPMIINPRGATLECIEKAGFERNHFIEVKRSIPPLLLELNAQGFLNGHTPFSAMLAFYTLLASALTGRKHIALSNESSANESTVLGTSVNHQYSKSLEFENDFREYVKNYISDSFNYFSFLRPLSELQIAMLFAQYPQYFSVFKSCNAGSKTDSWCGSCAKCLFAYIILSPFIAPRQLQIIFGKSMLDDISMQHFFDELTGKYTTKPFECVGTIEEVNVALRMTIQRFYSVSELPVLLKNYVPQELVLPLDILSFEHNVSADLLKIIPIS